MYSNQEETGMFARKRVPIDQWWMLERRNVVAVIISADAPVGRQRAYSYGPTLGTGSTGTLVDRIAESFFSTAHVFCRRGGELLLLPWEADEWVWNKEDDPFGEIRFSALPVVVPGKDAVVFYAPNPLLTGYQYDESLRQFEEGMY
jgi:hypothetical protein